MTSPEHVRCAKSQADRRSFASLGPGSAQSGHAGTVGEWDDGMMAWGFPWPWRYPLVMVGFCERENPTNKGMMTGGTPMTQEATFFRGMTKGIVMG